jgi:hypothetical protein
LSFFCRIIQSTDVPELLDFENKKLAETIADENERQFAKWNSKWRQESLEHYAGLGWSFLARNPEIPNSLCGLFYCAAPTFFGRPNPITLD